jgi:hypothetical protein
MLVSGSSPTGRAASYLVTERYISPPEFVVGDALGYMPVSVLASAHMSDSPKVALEGAANKINSIRRGLDWPLQQVEQDSVQEPQSGGPTSSQSEGLVVYAAPQYFMLDPVCLSSWAHALASAPAHHNITLAVTINPYAHVVMGHVNTRLARCRIRVRWHQRARAELDYLHRAFAADLYGMLHLLC